MRVVVSIQAKAASSRGLVHYVAHSKVDAAREPDGREIFNSYADAIAVEKANDFLKAACRIKDPRTMNFTTLSFRSKPKTTTGSARTKRRNKNRLKKSRVRR